MKTKLSKHSHLQSYQLRLDGAKLFNREAATASQTGVLVLPQGALWIPPAISIYTNARALLIFSLDVKNVDPKNTNR